jgi:hypothetical protein
MGIACGIELGCGWQERALSFRCCKKSGVFSLHTNTPDWTLSPFRLQKELNCLF